jgi:hypothetical protein
VCDRALGGCNDADCIVPLRADYHRRYDLGEFDVLPYLTKDEQAHAVRHRGIIQAFQDTTGTRLAVAS